MICARHIRTGGRLRRREQWRNGARSRQVRRVEVQRIVRGRRCHICQFHHRNRNRRVIISIRAPKTNGGDACRVSELSWRGIPCVCNPAHRRGVDGINRRMSFLRQLRKVLHVVIGGPAVPAHLVVQIVNGHIHIIEVRPQHLSRSSIGVSQFVPPTFQPRHFQLSLGQIGELIEP